MNRHGAPPSYSSQRLQFPHEPGVSSNNSALPILLNTLCHAVCRHDQRTLRDPGDRAILEKLTDWTELDEPTQDRNLERMDHVLGLNFSTAELAELIHCKLLSAQPAPTREAKHSLGRTAATDAEQMHVRVLRKRTAVLASQHVPITTFSLCP